MVVDPSFRVRETEGMFAAGSEIEPKASTMITRPGTSAALGMIVVPPSRVVAAFVDQAVTLAVLTRSGRAAM